MYPAVFFAYMLLPCLLMALVLWVAGSIHYANHPDPVREAIKKRRREADPLSGVAKWIWLVVILVAVAKAC